MTTTRTTEQIQNEASALTMECPNHMRVLIYNAPCACDGTGRAPLLEGVREPCKAMHPVIERTRWNTSAHDATCATVGCKGWVASRDLGVWLTAVLPLGWVWIIGAGTVEIMNAAENRHVKVDRDREPLLENAIYRALEKALLQEIP